MITKKRSKLVSNTFWNILMTAQELRQNEFPLMRLSIKTKR
jgi:hypothetical protein